MRKLRKRDRYLIVSVAAVVGFTVAALWLSHGDHSIPDSLIAGWFAFWATEIYHIAKITINGKKDGENNEEGIQ